MSTNARKSVAMSGRQAAADAGDQIRNVWTNIKEALRTRNGHYFILAVQFLLSFLSLLYLKGVITMFRHRT